MNFAVSITLSISVFLFLGGTFFLVQSEAGDAKGNGGGALVCPGKNLEILDYYEARLFGFGEPTLGNPDDFMEMANEYLSRLAVFSPRRAQLLRNRLESFLSEAVFLDNIPLSEIDDLGVTLPPECVWRQVVNQNPTLLPLGKSYLIDRVLWSQLSSLQRVGLVFHEIFYRESTSHTSQGIRRLNGLLATKKLNDMTLSERVLVFKTAGLEWAEAQGLAFLLDPEIEFDSTGNTLLKGTAVEGSTFFWKNQPVQLRADLVQFYKNGHLKSARIRGYLQIPFRGEFLEIETWEHNRSFLQFHENGEFKEGPLSFQKIWRLSTENLKLEFTYINFDEMGHLRSVANANGFVRLNSASIKDHSEKSIENDSEVLFYTSGALKSFSWGSRQPLTLWAQEVFPRYGTLVNFDAAGAIQSFVSDKDGHLQLQNQEWLTFKAGELIHLRP